MKTVFLEEMYRNYLKLIFPIMKTLQLQKKVLLYNIRVKGKRDNSKLYLQCDLNPQSYTNCDKDILGVLVLVGFS